MDNVKLDELYRQMVRVVRHKLICKNEALDVVQEAWVRILEKIDTLRESDKLVPWAKTIAANLDAQGLSRAEILDRLDAVRAAPQEYAADATFAALVEEIVRRERREISKFNDALRPEALPFETWGASGIDAAATQQMQNALRLPVAVAGALMPDAHVGYGLPIGGVLATDAIGLLRSFFDDRR